MQNINFETFKFIDETSSINFLFGVILVNNVYLFDFYFMNFFSTFFYDEIVKMLIK